MSIKILDVEQACSTYKVMNTPNLAGGRFAVIHYKDNVNEKRFIDSLKEVFKTTVKEVSGFIFVNLPSSVHCKVVELLESFGVNSFDMV